VRAHGSLTTTSPLGDWVANLRRLKREDFDRFLTTFEAWQIGADKGVSQNIPQGGKYICSGGTGSITGKRDESSELVARLVLEEAGGAADQGLPKELKHVVFLQVFAEAKDLQIAKERFGIAGNLTFLGIGFQDQVEPTPFKSNLP